MDLAFHDTLIIVTSNMVTLITSMSIENKDNTDNKISDNEYLKMFWVGLMEGDGSIQVNH
jgi:hypothetical protein